MQLTIRDFRLTTVLGAYDWEQEAPREIRLNLEIEFDASNAAKTDRLEDTLDYTTLTASIAQHVEATRYTLIERLVDEVASMVLSFSRVRNVTVEAIKPNCLDRAAEVSMRAYYEQS